MSSNKGFDEPGRDRGNRQSPGHGDKDPSRSGDRDREFGGQPKHDDPMKKERDERSPREPRT
jgi:hypothetical protein